MGGSVMDTSPLFLGIDTHARYAPGSATARIEATTNALFDARLGDVKRIPHARALPASTTHRHDYLRAYVDDHASVIDLGVLRGTRLRLRVDPLEDARILWAR